jgi:hypothetical protein
VDASGRTRSSGTRELKATQSYPVAFGAAHAVAFRDVPATAGAPRPGCFLDPAVVRGLDDAWWLADFAPGGADFVSNAEAGAINNTSVVPCIQARLPHCCRAYCRLRGGCS